MPFDRSDDLFQECMSVSEFENKNSAQSNKEVSRFDNLKNNSQGVSKYLRNPTILKEGAEPILYGQGNRQDVLQKIKIDFESIDPSAKVYDAIWLARLKQEIEMSFQKSKKITEGFDKPGFSGVKATKVTQLFPMFEQQTTDAQIMFTQDSKLSSRDPHEVVFHMQQGKLDSFSSQKEAIGKRDPMDPERIQINKATKYKKITDHRMTEHELWKLQESLIIMNNESYMLPKKTITLYAAMKQKRVEEGDSPIYENQPSEPLKN